MRPSASVTTISSRTARRIALRVSAVASGCLHAVGRSGSAQRHQTLLLRARQHLLRHGRAGGDPLFLPAHLRQPVVPPSLQLGRDKAVRWIDGIVLALCQIGLVARLRQRQLRLPSDLGVVALTGLDGGQRRLDAERRQQPQHGFANSGIDAQAAEGDAALGAVVDMRALATVADSVSLGAAVVDMHAPAAMSAAQQAGVRRDNQVETPASIRMRRGKAAARNGGRA